MDIRRLSLFARVYETGSLTEAARDEFVSRQAVSRAISQLEGELGPLFTRMPRGVRPTDLACAIYPHAKQAVEACAAIEGEALRFARGAAGALRLAVEANAALTLPLDLTAAYRRARPGVELHVVSLPGGMALDQLREGRVDAVVAGPAPDADLAFAPIFSSTLSVVFSAKAFGDLSEGGGGTGASGSGAGSPDGGVGAQGGGEGSPAGTAGVRDGGADARGGALVLGPEALAGRTIFGVAPDNYVERLLVPYLAERGIDARVVFDVTDTMLATSEMEVGAGGVIVEDGGAGRRFGDARYVHVRLVGEDAPRWQVGVVYRQGAPCAPVARDFAAFAQGQVDAAEGGSDGRRGGR